MQSSTSTVQQWAFRTPIKPRLTTQATTTPATFDTAVPMTYTSAQDSSPVTQPASGERTQDSESPPPGPVSYVAASASRVYDYRNNEVRRASPVYNTVSPVREFYLSPELHNSSWRQRSLQTLKPVTASNSIPGDPSVLTECSTPMVATPSAQRFKFDTNPLDMFQASADRRSCPANSRGRTPDSLWVNVSPEHCSVLLYTSGVTYDQNVAGCSVVYGPDPDQKIAFTIPIDGAVEGAAQSPEHSPAAASPSPLREFVSRQSSLSMSTPVPSRSGPTVAAKRPGEDRAALRAAIAALESRKNDWKSLGYTRLVIATDNKSVISGACDWLDEWRRNKWTTEVHPRAAISSHASTAYRASPESSMWTRSAMPEGRRQLVENADLWQWLDKCLSELKSDGVTVQFLHIPEEWNAKAKMTAELAVGLC